MLKLTVPASEYFDDRTQMFINTPEQSLELEHSLYTISKWESKWKKAFLKDREKTQEEMYDYIRCMIMTPNVDSSVFMTLLNNRELNQKITDYINDKMSATYLNNDGKKEVGGDVVTSELIYYWMVALQIPFECQHWHLNRLLTLIQVCNIKNNPNKKKMSKGDLLRQHAELNAKRRAQYASRR
jgi:hypothetical protein